VPTQVHIADAPLFVALGILIYLGVWEAWLSRSRSAQAYNLPAGLWCLCAASMLIGRLVQRSALGIDSAALGVRLQIVGGLLMGLVTVFVARARGGYEGGRRPLGVMSLGIALASVVTLATPWVTTNEAYVRTDAFGRSYYALESGPAALGLVLVLIVVLVFSVHALLNARRVIKPWKLMVTSVFVLAITIVNDVLFMTGRISSVHLMEYGLFVVGLAFAWVDVRRVDDLYATIEETLSQRTDELRQQQRRQMLTDRLASVGRLAAGTAHEINNPLGYVTSNVQLLHEAVDEIADRLDREEAEDLRRLLTDAFEGCQRIRGIVEDLRPLSRAEEPHLGPVDVSAVMETAIRMSTTEIRHRARLERHFEPVPAARADEGRLCQVFINLLVNAAQAITEGDAESNVIEVRVGEDPAGGVSVSVRDSGEGIPEDQFEHIFEPFVTTKPRGTGTGLGLAICHGIVASLESTIRVESEVGEGTTFTVVLPFWTEAVDEAPAPEAVDRSAAPSCARVLIVDDEPGVGRALRRALRGHDVTVVESGNAALSACEASAFDVILCDLMMPEMDGISLYEHLGERDPELLPRVVFITGGAFTARGREFVKNVENPTLDKPVDLSELRQVVRRVAGRG